MTDQQDIAARNPNQVDSSSMCVVAAAVVLRRDKKLLALRRAHHKPGAGLWEVVSGRVVFGEEPLETAQREVQEETGLIVDIHPRPITAYAAKRGEKPMIVIVYGSDVRAGELVRSDEHDDHAWLTPAQFRERSSLARLCDSVDAFFEICNRIS